MSELVGRRARDKSLCLLYLCLWRSSWKNSQSDWSGKIASDHLLPWSFLPPISPDAVSLKICLSYPLALWINFIKFKESLSSCTLNFNPQASGDWRSPSVPDTSPSYGMNAWKLQCGPEIQIQLRTASATSGDGGIKTSFRADGWNELLKIIL